MTVDYVRGDEVAWLLLALTLFAGAASPGPSLALVIRHTLSAGRGAGLRVAVAHGLGVWLYALAVVFGVATLLTHLSGMMLALQFAGMVFLCYLGAGMIRSGWKASSDASLNSPAVNGIDTGSYFRDGFLIVFLNPKIMVFFLAVFSQFLTSAQSLMAQVYAASLAGVIDRGVAAPAGQTLEEVAEERVPLYEGYADITLDIRGMDSTQALTALLRRLSSNA